MADLRIDRDVGRLRAVAVGVLLVEERALLVSPANADSGSDLPPGALTLSSLNVIVRRGAAEALAPPPRSAPP